MNKVRRIRVEHKNDIKEQVIYKGHPQNASASSIVSPFFHTMSS